MRCFENPLQIHSYLNFRALHKVFPPPKRSPGDVIPEATASWFSILMFGWMTPLLILGWSRPLEATDLYQLQPDRSASAVSAKIMGSYNNRCRDAASYNEKLASGEIKIGWRRFWWNLRGTRYRQRREEQWRTKDGQRKGSLVWAMNDTVKRWFWVGGVLRLISDISEVCSSLVVKVNLLVAPTLLC